MTPDVAADWGVASRPIPGEDVSGDRAVVAPFPGGLLVAAIDGLGHGPEAHAAAEAAARALGERPGDPPEALLRRCHEALRGTRGAAVTVASVRPAERRLEWIAVGNVEAALVRADPGARRASLVLRGGVVGSSLPSLRTSTAEVMDGDALVLATDGLRDGFLDAVDPRLAAGATAGRLLALYARGTDDALVVVARFPGASP